MRRLSGMLLVAMVALFIPGVPVEAAPALNPETFESYTTGTWRPAEAKDGWKLEGFGKVGEAGSDLIASEYLKGADIQDSGIDGKYLRIVAGGWNGGAIWKASLDKGKTPRQVFEATFRFTDRVAGANQARWGVAILIGPNYWDTVASFVFENNKGAGASSAILTTTWEEAIPGGTNWKMGDWLTVQVELDYTNETVRAQFGPAGGKFNDWTKPMFMKQTGQYESISFLYNGTIDIDNLKIVPGSGL